MTVALSSRKLKQWIGNAIDAFRTNDLLGVPEPWMRIYESLADYISGGSPIDQQLTWMIEGTDDSLADVIYQLQRLKNALVSEALKEDARDELPALLTWFDQTIVTLVEHASGNLSEERTLSVPYETVFWKARDGMYISTMEGKFIHCNQALMDMLKFDNMQDLLTMDISNELYVDHEKRQVMLDHLLRDRFYDHHEFEFRCQDGDVKTAIESCYLVDLPNGRRFIVGIMVDVTEEKEIEHLTEEYVRNMEAKRMEAHFSLRQVARRFEALQKVNDHPVIMVDPKEFQFLNYNAAFTKRFKYTRKHLERISFRDLFGKTDWMEIFTQISNATHRMQFHISNVSCITFEGDSFTADLSIVIHQDDLGSALFIQIEDRSEINQLEHQLNMGQENHRDLMEGAPIGIIGFRGDGSVFFVNRFLAKRMGYRAYQLKNLSFVNKLFSKDEYRLKFNKYVNRFLRGQHAEDVGVELRTKKGEPLQFTLNTVTYRLSDNAKPGFLALLTEVSGNRAALTQEEGQSELEDRFNRQDNEMEQLRGQMSDMRDKVIFREDFLKVLAKKFKVPIHVVLGFSSLLKKDLAGVINEDQREDIGIIEKHIGHILNMLEKAAEFAQLEDGEIQYLPEACYVRRTFDELFEKLIPKWLPEGVVFTAEHQILSVDLMIDCDVAILEAMLRHVIDNAVEHTTSGSIELTAYDNDEGLWLAVRDTGHGIDPTEMDRVFEPFFQVQVENEADHKGLGLGLAIVKKYADLINADIQILPRLSAGVKVRINLGHPTSEE